MDEWKVLLHGKLFSDRFNSEDECIEHIEECVLKGCGDYEYYSYDKMTKTEIEEYYK